MRPFGAICGAGLGILCSWLVAGVWGAGLSHASYRVALMIVLVSAAAVGALAGAAVAGRARRQPEQLALFSGLAAGTAGGILGAVLALIILASYLYTYAGWPSDRGDQILTVLAFPSFGVLGFLLGAGVAGLVGLVAGSVLGLVGVRR